MLKDLTDEQLMADYQTGDEDAFAILYERHSAKVYGFLRKKTSTEALARDVFQATFLKLHVTRDRYKPGLPFLPWLFTLCRNELIDAFRKRSRTLEDFMEVLPEPAPSESRESAAVISLVAIPKSQRTAIEMRYEEDRSYEEIAKRLSISPTNARKLVSRGISALRKIYGSK